MAFAAFFLGQTVLAAAIGGGAALMTASRAAHAPIPSVLVALAALQGVATWVAYAAADRRVRAAVAAWRDDPDAGPRAARQAALAGAILVAVIAATPAWLAALGWAIGLRGLPFLVVLGLLASNGLLGAAGASRLGRGVAPAR